jgi:hypothetical protein
MRARGVQFLASSFGGYEALQSHKLYRCNNLPSPVLEYYSKRTGNVAPA